MQPALPDGADPDPDDGTVKNHVSRILAKLDVCDRTRAVLKKLLVRCGRTTIAGIAWWSCRN